MQMGSKAVISSHFFNLLFLPLSSSPQQVSTMPCNRNRYKTDTSDDSMLFDVLYFIVMQFISLLYMYLVVEYYFAPEYGDVFTFHGLFVMSPAILLSLLGILRLSHKLME